MNLSGKQIIKFFILTGLILLAPVQAADTKIPVNSLVLTNTQTSFTNRIIVRYCQSVRATISNAKEMKKPGLCSKQYPGLR